MLQKLQLEQGERAKCVAGYPHKSKLIVECIKDFDTAPNNDDIVNNPFTYVKVVDGGKYGVLTSHWISGGWTTDIC